MASGSPMSREDAAGTLVLALDSFRTPGERASMLAPVVSSPHLAPLWRAMFGSPATGDLSGVDPDTLLKFANSAVIFLCSPAPSPAQDPGGAQAAADHGINQPPAAAQQNPAHLQPWDASWDRSWDSWSGSSAQASDH